MISQCHSLIFDTEIDDHVVRWGNTGQILTRWQYLVASKVALDLLYWVMCLALNHLIRIAIKMASEVGAFCSVIDFYVMHKCS
jgi:hypothetical protein